MSVPYFFDYTVPQCPRHMLDQHLGLDLSPEDLITAASTPIIPRYKAWWPRYTGCTIKDDKEKWHVNVDVQHFAPDEITVGVSNGYITVEGNHEEKKDDHGFVSRNFCRKLQLPEDINRDAVESRLSSDGVLIVEAPKKEESVEDKRPLPIILTGPVRKEVIEEITKE